MICTVKYRITPEHQIHEKVYIVVAVIVTAVLLPLVIFHYLNLSSLSRLILSFSEGCKYNGVTFLY